MVFVMILVMKLLLSLRRQYRCAAVVSFSYSEMIKGSAGDSLLLSAASLAVRRKDGECLLTDHSQSLTLYTQFL